MRVCDFKERMHIAVAVAVRLITHDNPALTGIFIILSGTYYSIGSFYYIIRHVLHYRDIITLSVGVFVEVFNYFLQCRVDSPENRAPDLPARTRRDIYADRWESCVQRFSQRGRNCASH